MPFVQDLVALIDKAITLLLPPNMSIRDWPETMQKLVAAGYDEDKVDFTLSFSSLRLILEDMKRTALKQFEVSSETQAVMIKDLKYKIPSNMFCGSNYMVQDSLEGLSELAKNVYVYALINMANAVSRSEIYQHIYTCVSKCNGATNQGLALGPWAHCNMQKMALYMLYSCMLAFVVWNKDVYVDDEDRRMCWQPNNATDYYIYNIRVLDGYAEWMKQECEDVVVKPKRVCVDDEDTKDQEEAPVDYD